MKEDKDCIFCKMARGEISVDKTYENDKFFAILDIKPRAEGHTLIISREHFKTLLDAPSSIGSELLDAVKDVSLDLIKQGKVRAEGFNFIVNNGRAAGQLVDHFHLHVIPRKKDDGLRIG